MTLEGDTLLQLKKWLDSISYAFWQSLSTNRSCTTYQNLVAQNNDMTKFILPPDDHYKYITAKENYEALSRALIVHLVKYTTISSSKAPKSHVKPVTNIQYYNGFELLIAVIFKISPQFVGLGSKAQDLVIPFFLGEV